MMKCCYCQDEKEITEIKNFVVHYRTWRAYNCCSKGCAKLSALNDGINNDEIEDIE